MLKYGLVHPPLLAALGRAGHGSGVLIADGNYPHAASGAAEIIHLNLAPGVVRVDQVLEAVLDAVPVERARIMIPDDGEPEVLADFHRLLPGIRLEELERGAFYAAAQDPATAVLVATADERTFANLLLTIGVIERPTARRA